MATPVQITPRVSTHRLVRFSSRATPVDFSQLHHLADAALALQSSHAGMSADAGFAAFFEFVARAVHSAAWQQQCNDNFADAAFARFHTTDAVAAWDAYADACAAMLERLPLQDDYAEALNRFPVAEHRRLCGASAGSCRTCHAHAAPTHLFVLRGDAYARAYMTGTAPLHALRADQQKSAQTERRHQWRVCFDCVINLTTYHALRHYLWALVRGVGACIESEAGDDDMRAWLHGLAVPMPPALQSLERAELTRTRQLLACSQHTHPVRGVGNLQ